MRKTSTSSAESGLQPTGLDFICQRQISFKLNPKNRIKSIGDGLSRLCDEVQGIRLGLNGNSLAERKRIDLDSLGTLAEYFFYGKGVVGKLERVRIGELFLGKIFV